MTSCDSCDDLIICCRPSERGERTLSTYRKMLKKQNNRKIHNVDWTLYGCFEFSNHSEHYGEYFPPDGVSSGKTMGVCVYPSKNHMLIMMELPTS